MPAMPPQGPPPGPQGAPPPQGGQDDQGAPQGGAASGLLQTLDKAIDHVNTMVQQSKALQPEQKQMFGQIDQMFGQFMDSIGGGGGEPDGDEGGGAQGQTVPPEAAGNKGAIPSPM